MSDLISRQAAIEATCYNCTQKEICDGICDDTDRLRELPTIDAVPVVRCRECKNMYEDCGGTVCVYGAFVDCITPNDFYCAFGERSEE